MQLTKRTATSGGGVLITIAGLVWGAIEKHWGWAVISAVGNLQTVWDALAYSPPLILTLAGIALILYGQGIFDLFKYRSPRMPILDFVRLAAETHHWQIKSRKDRNTLYRFSLGMRQGAVDGALTLSGRKRGAQDRAPISPLAALKADYFQDHIMDLQSAFDAGNNKLSRTALPSRGDEEYFDDLHVVRRQALRWLRTEGESYRLASGEAQVFQAIRAPD